MVDEIAWLGGQSDLSCVLHSTLDSVLKFPPRSLSTIHDPLSDDDTPSGSMVCRIDSTLPANRTAATAEVIPSVLNEIHFIGFRKAASLIARANPGLEPKPNVEPTHESEPKMRFYKKPSRFSRWKAVTAFDSQRPLWKGDSVCVDFVRTFSSMPSLC
jgi:hypothetical protein